MPKTRGDVEVSSSSFAYVCKRIQIIMTMRSQHRHAF